MRASESDIKSAAEILNSAKKVTILGGIGCAGAHGELLALAEKLQAPIVHALRGKEFIEYDNPYDVGMTGLLGFSSGYHAHDGLRCAAHAGHRLPVHPVLSGESQDHSG